MNTTSAARLAALAGAVALTAGLALTPTVNATFGDHLLDLEATYPVAGAGRITVDVSGPDAPTVDDLYAASPCLQVTVTSEVRGSDTIYLRPTRPGDALHNLDLDVDPTGPLTRVAQMRIAQSWEDQLGQQPLFASCTHEAFEASTSTTSTSTSSTSTTVVESTTTSTSSASSTSSTATGQPATTEPVDTAPGGTDLSTTTTEVAAGITTTAPTPLPVTGGATSTWWALAVLACGAALAAAATRRST